MYDSIRTIDMYLNRILCDSVVANKECAHCSKKKRSEDLVRTTIK